MYTHLQKAKKKPLEEINSDTLGVDMADLCKRQEVISVKDPPIREAGSKVADVDELVSKLKEAGTI